MLPATDKIEQPTKRKRGRPTSPVLHQKLLRTTLELIAEVGIVAMSVDSVATRAGVSKATIYSHWPSKEELCLEAVRSLHPALPEIAVTNPREAVSSLLNDIINPPQDDLDGRVLTRLISEAPDNPRLTEVWRSGIINPRRARLTEVLKQAVAQGQLRPDIDCDLVVDLLIAPIFYRRLVSGASLEADLSEKLISAVWQAFAPKN